MSLKAQFEQLLRHKIALMIVVGGVVAFGFVGVLAYKKVMGGQNTRADMSQEDLKELQITATTPTQKNVAPSQAQKLKQNLKRQKSISEKQITGSWIVPLNDGQALVELNGGTYRLIIVPRAGSRWYSNGRYTLKDDLLMMTPNLEWGPPASNKFNYRLLTRGSIPVMVSTYQGRLVWQAPSADMDIYVPPSHPFLNLTREGIAVWNVLK